MGVTEVLLRRLKRKKYIGMCRREFNPISVIQAQVPHYGDHIRKPRNRRKRGSAVLAGLLSLRRG